MANATLRYRQAQYKSCPLDNLITPGSAVTTIFNANLLNFDPDF